MDNEPMQPRVLIIGAGFGGLSAARALAKVPVDITVVDRRNFHLFQPLLYQVATAGLNPSDIAWPIRSVLRDQANARVLLGEVIGVDPAKKEAILDDGRRLAYDWLILATGATHNYFGHDDWASVAPGLKRVDDATLIRRRILVAFERAENTTDEADLRHRRRGPDRRRARRRDCRACAPRLGLGFPRHRSAVGAHRADRGRRARAAGLPTRARRLRDARA